MKKLIAILILVVSTQAHATSPVGQTIGAHEITSYVTLNNNGAPRAVIFTIQRNISANNDRFMIRYATGHYPDSGWYSEFGYMWTYNRSTQTKGTEYYAVTHINTTTKANGPSQTWINNMNNWLNGASGGSSQIGQAAEAMDIDAIQDMQDYIHDNHDEWPADWQDAETYLALPEDWRDGNPQFGQWTPTFEADGHGAVESSSSEWVDFGDGTGQQIVTEFTTTYEFLDEHGNRLMVTMVEGKPPGAPAGVNIHDIAVSERTYDMRWREVGPTGTVLETGTGWPAAHLDGTLVGDAYPWMEPSEYGYQAPQFGGTPEGGGGGTGPTSDGSQFGRGGGYATPDTPSGDERAGSIENESPVDWGDDTQAVTDAIEELRRSNARSADDLWESFERLRGQAEVGEAISRNIGRELETQSDILRNMHGTLQNLPGGGGGEGEGGDYEIADDGDELPTELVDTPMDEPEGILADEYQFLPDPGDYDIVEPFTLEIDVPGGGTQVINFDMTGGPIWAELGQYRLLIRALVLFLFCLHMIGLIFDRTIKA